MTAILQDLRYAFRCLLKSPAFTAVAVLTLAVGIGANTAMFSLINAVMLRRLPVDKPEELVLLLNQDPGGESGSSFTNPSWEAIRDQEDIFAGVFAWATLAFDLAQGGVSQNIDGLFVSGRYFETLRVGSSVGRLITGDDDRGTCNSVAVLSHDFWHTHFHGEQVENQIVTLNRHPFHVVGVSRPGFHGMEVGKKFDIAVPLCASIYFDRRNIESRNRWWLHIAGRTRSGTAATLAARLEALSPSVMRAALPDTSRVQQYLQAKLIAVSGSRGLSPFRETFGEGMKVLMAGLATVLLIACANLTSVLLARVTGRSTEFGIRTALGASRARLVQQLLLESLLLCTCGALVGLVFAKWSADLIVRNLTTGSDSLFIDSSIDGTVLAFNIALLVLTATLVGLTPAVRATSTSLLSAVRGSRTRSHERGTMQIGKWLVAAQVALSLVLVIAGGLLMRTFITLATLDPGFEKRNVLVVTARPAWFAADTFTMAPEAQTEAYDEVVRRLSAIPGVESVARSFTTPIGDDNWRYTITTDSAINQSAYFNLISPGYLATLRMPLLLGRDFDQRDQTNAPPVAMINETLARRLFAGNALGHTFRRPGQAEAITIVGIVRDSKYESLRETVPPTVFLPASQAPAGGAAQEFVIRSAMSPATLAATVQRTIAAQNPDIPLRFHTVDRDLADSLNRERLIATIAGFFCMMALALAMIGLYGVLNYTVAHRQPEFGVRMALGAEPRAILGLVVKDVGLVMLTGVSVGLGLTWMLVGVLQRLLFELSAHDPTTAVVAVALLSLAAVAAAYLPARRAARVDPLVALRYE